ncbi:MAG: hypothetical protein IPG04_37145 [Polyangiaceae bacterium]|nr:hypothetical protein [Polyangiaceae bacterium]
MSPLTSHRSSSLLAGVLTAAAAASSTARAEPIDPAFPTVVVVGIPNTPAVGERLDRERTGRSNVAIPAQLSEGLRRSIGAIGQSPVVHPDGSFTVALTSPELIRISKDGSDVGRTSLGSSPAVRAPVLLPNGSLAVLTGAPSLVFVSTTGKVTATIALPRATFGVVQPGMGMAEGVASIVATEDGAVVVAANRSVIELDASSKVRMKVSLPERLVSDLLPHHGGWLAVTEVGNVYRIDPPSEPRKIGSLGSIVPGTAALLDDRTLVGQSPPNRIVALDLKSGSLVTRVGDSIFTFFDAPPSFGVDGGAWVTTSEGFLVGYDAAGNEVARAAADRGAALLTPSFMPGPRFPHHFGGPGPMNVARVPVLVDPLGRVAFARPNGRVGVRSEKGQTTTTDRGCGTPLALVPLAKERVVLACRDGTLVFYEPPADEPAPKP